jgi:rubrerythrin
MSTSRAKHFDVRRVLTKTPLARQHERRLDGKATRKPKPIPWGAFDRRPFPKPAIDLALDSCVKLAIGEYGAVQLYAQLTSAMALAGLPLDLVTASASICTDEARHADYAMQMARALTGDDVPIRVEKEVLETPWKKEVSLEDIDIAILHVAALSETISCALVAACLERATDATARALFANLVSDEVHHARFGWYYLSWRSPQWTRAERQRLADSMASNVVMIERRFWRGRDAPTSAAGAARALGVLESEGQRAAVRAVMESEIVPVLDSLGLGASHAWRMRERGGAGDAPEGELHQS